MLMRAILVETELHYIFFQGFDIHWCIFFVLTKLVLSWHLHVYSHHWKHQHSNVKSVQIKKALLKFFHTPFCYFHY